MAAPAEDDKVRRVFGFPNFWPVVEAKYPRFFEVAPKTLTAAAFVPRHGMKAVPFRFRRVAIAVTRAVQSMVLPPAETDRLRFGIPPVVSES